jgi:multimeric flavodoxin WrbA
MKVTAFNGSPRRDGNTAILINYMLSELENEGIRTELYQLAGKSIRGCIACYKCAELRNSRCAIEDDILNECVENMIQSDGLILGSPVYGGDLTAGAKALIERAGFVAKANNDLFKRKVGAGIVMARRAGAIHAFDSINHFFLSLQMIIPGANHWNVGIGREKGEVRNDEEGIATMKVLGRNMAWLLKKLQQ